MSREIRSETMRATEKQKKCMKQWYKDKKPQIQKRKAKHFQQHKEEYNKRKRDWYNIKKNKLRINKKRREIYPMKKEKINSYNRNWYLEYKQKVFDHYGWTCACCGETEKAFLSIDHINGGGCQHRKQIKKDGHKSGVSIYVWLIKNNFPTGFQTLCMNCQFGKRYGHICPHQLKKNR
jgi:hypothetical protein